MKLHGLHWFTGTGTPGWEATFSKSLYKLEESVKYLKMGNGILSSTGCNVVQGKDELLFFELVVPHCNSSGEETGNEITVGVRW